MHSKIIILIFFICSIRMGYKRCFEANEFEDLPFIKAKRLEFNDKLVSFAGSDISNNASIKPIASGEWCSFAIESKVFSCS